MTATGKRRIQRQFQARRAPGWQRRPEHLGGDDAHPWALGPCEILIRLRACGLHPVDPAPSDGATAQQFARGTRCTCGLDAAGTVIGTGERVTRFAIGDEVFGHFPAQSWAWAETQCGRTPANGPHVELRPEGLDPLRALTLARCGLTAKTIIRAAKLRPGQKALVIGADCETGNILLLLLAETGAYAIEWAPGTLEPTTGNPVCDAFKAHPDVDLVVDLVSWGEPYFITRAARQGTIVSPLPCPDGPRVPRIRISAEPGDLAALTRM